MIYVIFCVLIWIGSAYMLARFIEKRKPLNGYTTGDDIMKGHNLCGKIIVITGGSSGLGKETVKILVKYGAIVYMLNRNKIKTQRIINELIKELKDGNNDNNNDIKNRLKFIKIDLSSLQSVYNCAKKIFDNNIKIDCLINNAGVLASRKYKTTQDNIELTFGVNHLGLQYCCTYVYCNDII